MLNALVDKLPLEELLEQGFKELGMKFTPRQYPQDINHLQNQFLFERAARGNPDVNLIYVVLYNSDRTEVYETVMIDLSEGEVYLQVAEIEIYCEVEKQGEKKYLVETALDYKNLRQIEEEKVERYLRGLALVNLLSETAIPNQVYEAIQTFFPEEKVESWRGEIRFEKQS